MNSQPWDDMAKRWSDTFQQHATLVRKQWLDGQARLTSTLASTQSTDPAASAAALTDLWRSWMGLGGFWTAPGDSLGDASLSTGALGALPNSIALPLTSGSQVSQMLRRMTEGPRLADVGGPERRMVEMMEHWISVQESARLYEGVMASAWAAANARFAQEITGRDHDCPRPLDSKETLRRWRDIANQVLLETQRSEKFLDAQRRLLRDGMNFMLIQREFLEGLVEPAGLPTRSEIDELHRSVHTLKHRVKTLEKTVAALPPQLAETSSSPRTTTKPRRARASKGG
jgi:hypothetical protein